MADKLDVYDWTAAPTKVYPRRTYPWHQWLNGDIWQLVRGRDFDAHPLMMERIIRTRATGYKTGVQIRHEPHAGDEEFGILIVQRTKGDTPQMKLPPKGTEPEPVAERPVDPLRPVRPTAAVA